MKLINKWFISLLAYLLGSLSCYIFLQYRYFVIDTELNVVDTIIAAISIGVGIYIAIVIHKHQNQVQNQYNYLVGRLDSLWSDFNSFQGNFQSTDQIQLSVVNKFLKDFAIKNSNLSRLLEIVPLNSKLESLIDQFESEIDNSFKKDNIIYYDTNKSKLLKISDAINEEFVSIYQEINNG